MNTDVSDILGPFQEIVGAIRDEVLVRSVLRTLNAKLDEASVVVHKLIADTGSVIADAKSKFGVGSLPEDVFKKLDNLCSSSERIETILKDFIFSSESAPADAWQRAEDVVAALKATVECARRLVEEIGHGKELLRRLADREADVAQSRGLRAYIAYRKVIGEVFPGAEFGNLEMVNEDGECMVIAPIKLLAPIDGRIRARQEQELHDRVEAQDPTLIGVLAFQYVVA